MRVFGGVCFVFHLRSKERTVYTLVAKRIKTCDFCSARWFVTALTELRPGIIASSFYEFTSVK